MLILNIGFAVIVCAILAMVMLAPVRFWRSDAGDGGNAPVSYDDAS